MPPVVINELLASNGSSLIDEDGDHSDWIELHNGSASPVDLKGWSLSDDPRQPDKWTFPTLRLLPDEYLLVFASGKDRASGDAPLHTNFKLDKEGEHLALYAPVKQNPVHAAGEGDAFPPQRRDVSYGIDRGGDWGFFFTPTPGRSNLLAGASISGLLPEPHFEPPRGVYEGPLRVRLASENSAAVIRFTRDGSAPNPDSERYSGALDVTQSGPIRAASFTPEGRSSRIATHTYLISPDAAQRSLPMVLLSGDPEQSLYEPHGVMAIVGGRYEPGDEGVQIWVPESPADYNNALLHGRASERTISFEWVERGHAPLQADCGLRVHGGTSRFQYRRGDDWLACENGRVSPNKFSLRLHFANRHGLPALPSASLQGFEGTIHCLVLRAGYQDGCNPFVRDELARRLYSDMGQISATGRLANLFINGEYKGYFNPVPRVDEDFLRAQRGRNHDWDVITRFEVKSGDRARWDALIDIARDAAAEGADVYEQIAEFLDVAAFIDYLLLQLYIANEDWPLNNWVAVREHAEGSRFIFLVWDSETAFSPVSLEETALEPHTWLGEGLNAHYAEERDAVIPWLYQALYPSRQFRTQFDARAAEHFLKGGALSEARVLAHFEALRLEMAGVLPDMDTWIATDFVPRRHHVVLRALHQHRLLDDVRLPATRGAHVALVDDRTAWRWFSPVAIEDLYQHATSAIDFTCYKAGHPITDLPYAGGKAIHRPQSREDAPVERVDFGAEGDPWPVHEAGGGENFVSRARGTALVSGEGDCAVGVLADDGFALQWGPENMAGRKRADGEPEADVFSLHGPALYDFTLLHFQHDDAARLRLLTGSTRENLAPLTENSANGPKLVLPWRHPRFDDSTWPSAGPQLRDDGAPVLLRCNFELTVAQQTEGGLLRLRLPEGGRFAAWINGFPVGPANQEAIESLDPIQTSRTGTSLIEIGHLTPELKPGLNVLAVRWEPDGEESRGELPEIRLDFLETEHGSSTATRKEGLEN